MSVVPASEDKGYLVLVGGSAGSIEALKHFLPALPSHFTPTLVVVVHFPPSRPSALPAILARQTSLPVRTATHGEAVGSHRILVAPPGKHLLFFGDRIRVVAGPKVHRHVPAIDPAMRSAAHWLGPRVMGVVLSGTLDDGALGLAAIQKYGGRVFVQDPNESMYPAMPRNALQLVRPDGVLSARDLAKALDAASREPVPFAPTFERPEADPAEELAIDPAQAESFSDGASGFTCPDCGGALWELKEGGLSSYHCRVGHRYSAESLSVAQAERVDDAVWAAYRVLVEKASLSDRLARRAERQGQGAMARTFEISRDETRRRAEALRAFLERTSHQHVPR